MKLQAHLWEGGGRDCEVAGESWAVAGESWAGLQSYERELGGFGRERSGALKLAEKSCGNPRAEPRLPAGTPKSKFAVFTSRIHTISAPPVQ